MNRGARAAANQCVSPTWRSDALRSVPAHRSSVRNRRYRALVLMQDARSGTSIELEVVGYQFPAMEPTGPGFDWDANWLRIRGRVTIGATSWAFADPCLTTWESAELGEWLLQAAAGEIDAGSDPGIGRGSRSFVEPNLAVKLTATDEATVSLVWSFSQESAPPGATEAQRYGDGVPVLVAVAREALRVAAEQWKENLRSFPIRGDGLPASVG